MGKNEVSCDCEVLHKDVVEKTIKLMPDDNTVFKIADFFKIFGDSTRVKILIALNMNEMCVCDIAVVLNMTKSAVSHQLRVLRESNFVKIRRAGKVVFYSLADEHVKEILETTSVHIEENRD